MLGQERRRTASELNLAFVWAQGPGRAGSRAAPSQRLPALCLPQGIGLLGFPRTSAAGRGKKRRLRAQSRDSTQQRQGKGAHALRSRLCGLRPEKPGMGQPASAHSPVQGAAGKRCTVLGGGRGRQEEDAGAWFLCHLVTLSMGTDPGHPTPSTPHSTQHPLQRWKQNLGRLAPIQSVPQGRGAFPTTGTTSCPTSPRSPQTREKGTLHCTGTGSQVPGQPHAILWQVNQGLGSYSWAPSQPHVVQCQRDL